MRKIDVSSEDIAVGKRILTLRKDVLKIDSQEKFAAALHNVTRGAVGNWELGKGIKRENMQRIADTFGISFEWLATGRGEVFSSARSEDPTQEEEFRRLWAGADEAMKRAALILLRGGQSPSKDQEPGA